MFFVYFFVVLSQDLPDGAGKETVLKLCQDCHDVAVVTMDNRTKEGWQKTVQKMIERGAEGSDEQFETVIAYMTKNFGRVNVNKASVEEMARFFSAKDAAAIVAYREKNGEFKDTQELKKVVDPGTVDANKNHIAVK